MPRANISAARLVFELQQTLFNRSSRLFEGKVLSENDYLRARATSRMPASRSRLPAKSCLRSA